MPRDIGGLENIKTSQKAKIRCKPKVEGQEYLDLYMLGKEKERLGRYMRTVTKAKETTQVSLEEVEEEIKELEKTVPLPEEDKQTKLKKRTRKKAPQKEWKKMILDY